MRPLSAIKQLLDQKYEHYNNSSFIEKDPVSIPHLYTKKQDIEIAGFFAATIAWGNRLSILKNASQLMKLMDHQPYDFILHHSAKDLKPFNHFVHRTFNGTDCTFFIRSLQNLYLKHGDLEKAFIIQDQKKAGLQDHIMNFRTNFLETKHEKRSEKHLSNPVSKSSAKRLCMFLRWMVRNDQRGVDFGIWQTISPSELCLPLDVHTGNVSRTLGLLKRRQNDWQAVQEITAVLRKFDPADPVKYDFALFGMGIDGTFKD